MFSRVRRSAVGSLTKLSTSAGKRKRGTSDPVLSVIPKVPNKVKISVEINDVVESSLKRTNNAPEVIRCRWAQNQDMHAYHDQEWGVFRDDDTHLFEMLILEGAQAGLNWSTILKKRNAYKSSFDQFEIEKVASYDESKVQELMSNAGIVRNRLKIKSAIKNAKVTLEIQKEFGSFSNYLWSIIGAHRQDGKGNKRVPIISTSDERVVSNEISDALSKDLKKRGMSFVGTTIIYAYMQAVGLVNDHDMNCFRR